MYEVWIRYVDEEHVIIGAMKIIFIAFPGEL